MTTQYYIPAGRYGVPPKYPADMSVQMAESYLAAADAHFDEGDYELAEREYRSASICYGRAGARQDADPLDRIGFRIQECRSRIRNHHPLWVARATA